MRQTVHNRQKIQGYTDQENKELKGYEESTNELTGRLQKAEEELKKTEGEVKKVQGEWEKYKIAHEVKYEKARSSEELEKELENLAQQKKSLVRKGPQDVEYSENLKILEKEEQEIQVVLEERIIIVTGKEKIGLAEEMCQKTLGEIRELLLRLPLSLKALKNSWTTRSVKEMKNAISKATNIAKRVEGTQEKVIVDGKKLVTGSYALTGVIERKLESWSKLTRDWKLNPRVLARNRTEELPQEVLDIIIGSLLGDATVEITELSEKAKKEGEKPGYIIKFLQGVKNGEYIKWLHDQLMKLGFAKKEKLKLQIMHQKEYIYPNSKFSERDQEFYQFRTFAFSSIYWIVEGFYVEVGGKKVKVVPVWIAKHLTPRALAIWIMDDGSNSYEGVRLCTNSFTLDGVKLLCQALKDNFDIESTYHKTLNPEQYVLYMSKRSKAKLRSIVGPYMHPSMTYKVIDLKREKRGDAERKKWRH